MLLSKSMSLPLCAILFVNACSATKTKLSVRNLSGGHLGVWWLQPARHPSPRMMIPQSTVSFRNSTSLDIDSFSGHEFVVRRTSVKETLLEKVYEVQSEEATLVVGASNLFVSIAPVLPANYTSRRSSWTSTCSLDDTMPKGRYGARYWRA